MLIAVLHSRDSQNCIFERAQIVVLVILSIDKQSPIRMLSNCKVVKSVGKINLCLLKVHNASLLVNFLEDKLGYGWVVINVWIVDI